MYVLIIAEGLKKMSVNEIKDLSLKTVIKE